MKHSVVYDNCGNHWDTALPLGNGNFGCMLFYEDDMLYMPMNHYEVYHNRRKGILPADEFEMKKNQPLTPNCQHRLEYERAVRNEPIGEEAYVHYRPGHEKSDTTEQDHAYGGAGASAHPQTGELRFTFGESLRRAKSHLVLYTEDAKVEFSLEKGENALSISTIVAREDCIISKINQSKTDLLDSILLDFSPYQTVDVPELSYVQIDDHTFGYTASRMIEGETEKPFVFSGVIRLEGARGCLTEMEGGAEISLKDAERVITVFTGIFTDWNYREPLLQGVEKMNQFQDSVLELYEDHKNYWDDFFARSSISIPDKFLEHIYYVNQYALDCSSGKDGIMKHQACGLNGLWGIRNPYIWFSTWYWDVNIQAAFAGVFSSNRLELGKVFSDGLLSYRDLAKWYARALHHLPGCAADYPYPFYYSTWPWCAQYLWAQYEYSQDENYLRNDAYPLFLELAEFLVALFQYDEKTDTYFVYPDISPEQGPLAHNTTITIACAKYLLKFTLKAAEILNDHNSLLTECKELLEKMPPYALSEDGLYGVHFKDSPDAPDDMWIRHPSMLMPLFPIGEYDISSDEKTKEILENTIKFLEERCEIGIFGGSWLAAAAARLGRGQMALRLLYERGIDHMLRSSGLTAEQTERFMNYCLIGGQPRFYPDMMEFTGQMLAAVNEMLLQSHNDVIRVFPALPDGNKEMYRMHLHGYAAHEYAHRFATYEPWKTVRFDRLLAKGAFEISASLKDGKLEWILIHSKKGGKIQIACPYLEKSMMVSCNGELIPSYYEDQRFRFEAKMGETYLIALSADAYIPIAENEEYNDKVLVHKTYTKRHIFIGENKDTAYQKALDGFLRSWYLGNTRMENHTVYKFDFGKNGKKEYERFLSPQSYGAEEMLMMVNKFRFLGEDDLLFTPKRGYGFSNCIGMETREREMEDILRRDFVQGTETTEFVIDAPRGQYELLAVSGDLDEENITILETENGSCFGGEVVEKGEFQCELIPIIQKKDTHIRLKISTKPGYRWKLNLLMVNAIKGY